GVGACWVRCGRGANAQRARDLFLAEGAQRIDRRSADAHLEVQMRPGRVAGRADEANADALPDPDADAHVDARKVGVHRALAVAVRDRYEQAVAVAPAGPDDFSSA